MADAATKLPLKREEKPVQAAGNIWSPFETLRTEIDRLFDEFIPSSWRSSERSLFGNRTLPALSGFTATPAVDVVEKDDAYEVTAEFPGLDEKNIEVRLSNSFLTIRGEKQEEKEEKQKAYHLSERRYGSFQRSFQIPDSVDADAVEATFEKGILKVRLPKSAEAKKSERKIEIRSV